VHAALHRWVMGQQQFHAVQCFSCSTFQVQQVKKVAKFKCAGCGDKQSVRQVTCAACPAAQDPSSAVGHQQSAVTGSWSVQLLIIAIMCVSYNTLCTQVYAINDKAKDVRGVVSRLNTERGEREQMAIDLLAADPQAAACEHQALQQHQQPVQQAPWNDFLGTQVRCSPMRIG
jgi:predicted RNA-binding Zn-ribbon protein involved in translation (DUF1610 family)